MHTSIIAIENQDHEMNKKTLLKTNITLDALALNQQLIHQQHQNEKSSSTSPSSSFWPPATQMIVINAMQFIEALRNLSYVQ